MESLLPGGLSAVLLLLCLFLALILYYTTSHFGVWERVGVPGPKAWPIINHLPDLVDGLPAALDKWRARYGRTFGTYGLISKSATLITTDTSLMTHIFIKDFPNFTDRHNIDSTRSSILKGLLFQQGSTWRRQRHVISPMFTGGKLRLMMTHVNSSAAGLVSLIKQTKAKGGLIPLKKYTAKYTSDIIAKTGFGVNSGAIAEEDNEFSKAVAGFVILPNVLQNVFRALSINFPFLMSIGVRLSTKVDAINPEADRYFEGLARSAIEHKREERRAGRAPSAPRDMLDLFLMSENENKKQEDADGKEITSEEIIGNLTLLILAAFETTSQSLMATLYLLALHQDIQEKVIEEVDRVLGGKTEPTYDQLSELKYVEQVIYESLRHFPSVPLTTREIAETRTYDGITIPKGTNIMVPISKVLMDPEYFPNPEKFDPDRFGKEESRKRDASAEMQFGQGPRICVGKRLAMLDMKVLICHLFSQMRFILTDRTVPKKGEELEMLNIGFGAFQPKKPIELDIELRD